VLARFDAAAGETLALWSSHPEGHPFAPA
jgi:hypothetical protein